MSVPDFREPGHVNVLRVNVLRVNVLRGPMPRQAIGGVAREIDRACVHAATALQAADHFLKSTN